MMSKFMTKLGTAKKVLSAKRAEGYVDTGVKVIIAVVIGALVIAILVLCWNEWISPSVETAVADLFTEQPAA